MKEVIDLSNMAHAETSQVKKLVLESTEGESRIYKVVAYWKNDPNANDYIRIGYDDKDKSINFIDFDSGPFLGIGSIIGSDIVKGFTHNGNFGDVRVVLNEVSN